MPSPTSKTFREAIAEELEASARSLAADWLQRLDAILVQHRSEIFPSADLLDHVPRILVGIARDLALDETNLEAMSSVREEVQSLGALRHEQGASVHQVLREYDLLADVLDDFLRDALARMDPPPETSDALDVTFRVQRAVRTLLRTATHTFVERYEAAVEEQRTRLRSYNRMVNHELRNHVGTLSNIAHLIVDDGRSAEHGEMLHRSVQAIEGVLVTLAPLGLGELAPNGSLVHQEIDLLGVVEDVVERQRDAAEAGEVDLRVEGRFAKAVVDLPRLDLVLVNLLSNAIKYAHPERSERRVVVRGLRDAEGSLGIAVEDNGRGIPEELHEEVFRPFVRGGVRDVDGEGLGLAVVRESVDAMGGTLELESAEGEGTTVRVWLPQRSDGSGR